MALTKVKIGGMADGTDGNIISYDASGGPVAIATGESGEVLTSAGEGAPPTFAAAAAGGLTEADSWRLTTGFTGDADPIASNLARWSATGFGLLGTGMSQSAGIFTFPSTGYWAVLAQFSFGYAGDSRYCQGYIEVTVDADAGNTYSTLTMNGTSMTQIASETMSGALVVYGLVDVTSVAAVKVRFKVSVYDDSVDVIGGTANSTSFHFLKLGDT